MKNFLRPAIWIFSIAMAGFFSGCSHWSDVTRLNRPARDFEVVETSTKRTLNEKELAVLRAKVADYLEKQGATAGGSYFVKVFLGPDQAGGPDEWVVVRFSRDTEMRFQLLGSDDTYYAGYPAYAAYDYYPAGYDSFTRFSFQYYDQPYFGGGSYFPPRWRDGRERRRDRDDEHDRGRDRHHDGDGDHDNDHSKTSEHRRTTPPPPGANPAVTRARWHNDGADSNNPPSALPPVRRNNFPDTRSPGPGTEGNRGPINRSREHPTSPNPSPDITSARSAPSSQPSNPPAPGNPAPTRADPSQGSRSSPGSRESRVPAYKRDQVE